MTEVTLPSVYYDVDYKTVHPTSNHVIAVLSAKREYAPEDAPCGKLLYKPDLGFVDLYLDNCPGTAPMIDMMIFWSELWDANPGVFPHERYPITLEIREPGEPTS